MTCTEATSIRQLAPVMLERDVGSVIVIDDGDLPCGIITDRDLVLRGSLPADPITRRREVMSHDPAAVAEDETLLDAARQMALRDCRRLPVVDRRTRRLVGVVTLDDLLLQAGDALDQVLHLLNAERHGHPDLAAVLRHRQIA